MSYYQDKEWPTRIVVARASAVMSDINFLNACWQAQRALLSNELEMLERGEMHIGADGYITQLEIARLKSWIAELDELLSEHDG
jgi:hypothetical protein